MRKLTVIALSLALLPCQGWASAVVKEAEAVKVKRASGKLEPLAVDGRIEKGDTVETGLKGKAMLRFDDGQVVALQGNSQFRVTDYRYSTDKPEDNTSVLSLLKGGMRALTGLIGKANPSAVRYTSKVATIGIRGTDVMMVLTTVGKSTTLSTQVVSGAVAATNVAGQTALIAAGNGATVAATGAIKVVSASAMKVSTFSQLNNLNLNAVASAGEASSAAAEPAAATTETTATATSAEATTATTAAETGATAATTGTATSAAAASTTAAAAAGTGAAAGAVAAGATVAGISTTTLVAIGAVTAGVVASTSKSSSSTSHHSTSSHQK